MVAETPEEKKIEKLLEEARKSKEIIEFAEEIREELEGIEIPFYSYRVKKVHSAIRSFRIEKFEKLEDLHDLFGILAVVEEEEDIPEVARRIRNKLQDYQEYDLLTEKDWMEQKEARKKEKFEEVAEGYPKILADLKRIMAHTENLERVLPPLSYVIVSHIPMGDKMLPVEIRIQSKAGFHIIESSYFTLYKNDELDPKTKGHLLFVTQQLLSRKERLDTKKLTQQEKNKLFYEMGELYQNNFYILYHNRDVVLDVWREYEKIAAKYELQLPVYDFHFFGEKEKSEEMMEVIEQDLDEIFEEYQNFDLRKINTRGYVEEAVLTLQVESLV